MPRSGRYGYGNYRGRRSGASSVLKAIVVVLVLLIAALAALLYFIQPYLVYTDDGVILLTPWTNQDADASDSPAQSPSALPDESPTVSIVIENDPNSPQPSGSGVSEPENLHGVMVDEVSILAGSAKDQAELAGGNAVIVRMKNDDGTLNYVSSIPTAIESGATREDMGMNASLKRLTDSDIYTIAQISCFRDQLLPGYDSSLAIKTNSGYRWTDTSNAGTRWSSPANAAVREYLTEICVELAQMGFDEILLTNCGYPTGYGERLSWIRVGDAYPAGQLDTIITPFLTQVKTALEPYEVKLSIEAYGAELTGETSETGITMANSMEQCDRVWVSSEDAAAYPGLSSAGEKLVVISETAGVADSSWAILED